MCRTLPPMATRPQTIWLYRIFHRDNLEYICRNGVYAATHPKKNPAYTFIGDPKLTDHRKDYPIPLAGTRVLGDYVPFYLGPRSPMLYQIYRGGQGVDQQAQQDIVYLGCRLQDLEAANCEVLLTDGHARNNFTSFFRSKDDLSSIDWKATQVRFWKASEKDWDLQRRKQTEGLVKHHVPPECIRFFVTKSDSVATYIQHIVLDCGLNVTVHIDQEEKFYY